MRATRLGALTLCGLAVALSACSAAPDQTIRPLIDVKTGNYVVSSYEDADVQEAIELVADAVTAAARPTGKWADVDSVSVNEEIIDTAVVEADRNVNEYGGGTEAVSLRITERPLMTIGGDQGSCWVLRLSGDPKSPRLERSAAFAPDCSASRIAGMDLTFTDTWPSRPKPSGSEASAPANNVQGPLGANDAFGGERGGPTGFEESLDNQPEDGTPEDATPPQNGAQSQ